MSCHQYLDRLAIREHFYILKEKLVESLKTRSDSAEVLRECFGEVLSKFETMDIDRLFNHKHLGAELKWDDPYILEKLAAAVDCTFDYDAYLKLFHSYSIAMGSFDNNSPWQCSEKEMVSDKLLVGLGSIEIFSRQADSGKFKEAKESYKSKESMIGAKSSITERVRSVGGQRTKNMNN